MKSLGIFAAGLIFGWILSILYRKMRLIKKLHFQYEKLCEEHQAASFRAEILTKLYYLEKNGVSISEFFKLNQISNIIVYGYGIVGRIVVEELQKNGIEITCIIDRKAENIHIDFPVQTLDKPLPYADMIVVTSNNLDEVRKEAKKSGYKNMQVLSIKNIMQIIINN